MKLLASIANGRRDAVPRRNRFLPVDEFARSVTSAAIAAKRSCPTVMNMRCASRSPRRRARSRDLRRRAYLIATALGGEAMPPSRFIGTDTSMNS